MMAWLKSYGWLALEALFIAVLLVLFSHRHPALYAIAAMLMGSVIGARSEMIRLRAKIDGSYDRGARHGVNNVLSTMRLIRERFAAQPTPTNPLLANNHEVVKHALRIVESNIADAVDAQRGATL